MSLYSNIEINRQQHQWGRAYVVNGVSESPLVLPSVTTILKLIKLPKYEILKAKLGEEKYNEILANAAERGNVMHRMMELFLLEWAREKNVERSLKKAQIYAIEEGRLDYGKNLRFVKKGRDLFWNFYYENFWEEISEVVDNEAFLYTTFRGGWAGACDFTFRNHKKELIVDDFKSSTSAKEEEDIIAYKLQIVAYMFMCAQKYNEVPKMGRIRISNEATDSIQTFIVKDYEMKPYLRKFIELRKEFGIIHNI